MIFLFSSGSVTYSSLSRKVLLASMLIMSIPSLVLNVSSTCLASSVLKSPLSTKTTIRNISRYKKRVLITLIGSAGCTFMIMIGFALKDSINTVGDKQYNDLFKYDNLIILNQ